MNDISLAVETFRFNVAVARVMELVNATRKAIDSAVVLLILRCAEASEIVAISLSLIAPTPPKRCGRNWVINHQLHAGWPTVDPALLTQDSVTAIFQINGKIKSRVEVAPDISDADLEKMALTDAEVIAELAGTQPKKIITKAPKFVNIVL